ncbi:hypothetical protein GCM10010472_21730 [Pseudonocardia halophobica]|uniref:Uncharacterized protein n=1 Tax=Pseudonocardia halophobica TaxID=29401 RepID=A0A9W6KYA0_9PSEU|nr:hypothetical protein GCM10017577_05450 [Pseudonocardia halophobica]
MEMRVGFSSRSRRWRWVLRLSADEPRLGGWASTEAEAWAAMLGLTSDEDGNDTRKPGDGTRTPGQGRPRQLRPDVLLTKRAARTGPWKT